MDVRPEIAWLVLACAAVTAVPRVLPLVALSRVALPAAVMAWLRHVPVAVLAALLAIEAASFTAPGYAGIGAALAMALATRSLIATVAAGVGLFWVLL
jgi:branched-subunit amino acid transport protein